VGSKVKEEKEEEEGRGIEERHPVVNYPRPFSCNKNLINLLMSIN
jgi:hypothetical protein